MVGFPPPKLPGFEELANEDRNCFMFAVNVVISLLDLGYPGMRRMAL